MLFPSRSGQQFLLHQEDRPECASKSRSFAKHPASDAQSTERPRTTLLARQPTGSLLSKRRRSCSRPGSRTRWRLPFSALFRLGRQKSVEKIKLFNGQSFKTTWHGLLSPPCPTDTASSSKVQPHYWDKFMAWVLWGWFAKNCFPLRGTCSRSCSISLV